MTNDQNDNNTRHEQSPEKSKKQKPKRSLFDHIINFICIGILIWAIFNEFRHLYKPETPLGEYTSIYDRKIAFTLFPPFVLSYYLIEPENYNPAKKYPLVLALHGVSEYVYAGYYLSKPEFRKKYPAFVLVPFMSKRSVWSEPEDERYQLMRGGVEFPDALPQAVSLVNKARKNYNIDDSRIYITGHSGGGIGAYGALKHYPDLFAGALIVSGTWDPSDAPYMAKIPLWAFHGTLDRQIPYKPSEQLVENIKEIGGKAAFTGMNGAGHDIWKTIYPSNEVWQWLFSQKRSP